MKKCDISETVLQFYDATNPTHRYASFDYCYNYFRSKNKALLLKDMEKSCAILGFFLASWGMLRTSSFTIEKSYKYYIPVVKYLADLDKSLWEITPEQFIYTDIQNKIINIYKDIKNIVIEKNNREITLITKIMLGTIGIIPAYDTNFCKYFKTLDPNKSKFSVFRIKTLEVIAQFYIENKIIIDSLSFYIKTYNFKNDNTVYNYPVAKIIDMYGFIKGTKI